MALMVKAVLFGMEKCEVWPEVIGTGKMQTLAPDFHGSIQFASVSIASRNLPQQRHAMNKSTSQQKMDCPLKIVLWRVVQTIARISSCSSLQISSHK